MVIPSRWFTGGRENLVGGFRHEMLTSNHTHKLTAFSNAKDLFPDAEIKGGCCYFLFDPAYNGNCLYRLVRDGITMSEQRDLSQFEVLIREPLLATIVKKVSSDSNNFVEALISSDTPFGIPTNPGVSKKNPIVVYGTASSQHNTILFYIKNSVRTTSFVDMNDIKKNSSDIHKYKVLVPKAYGAGETYPHQILGLPVYAPNNSVCSQSYLYVPFETENAAKNFIKYYRSRLFRVLVLASKITQDAMSKVYRFVPMQDFTERSDIDWSKNVAEIDKQLFAKYKLSADEIAFIESMIKPMQTEE